MFLTALAGSFHMPLQEEPMSAAMQAAGEVRIYIHFYREHYFKLQVSVRVVLRIVRSVG